eukprot:9487695-Pyramimonas_sp.AAC.1
MTMMRMMWGTTTASRGTGADCGPVPDAPARPAGAYSSHRSAGRHAWGGPYVGGNTAPARCHARDVATD